VFYTQLRSVSVPCAAYTLYMYAPCYNIIYVRTAAVVTFTNKFISIYVCGVYVCMCMCIFFFFLIIMTIAISVSATCNIHRLCFSTIFKRDRGYIYFGAVFVLSHLFPSLKIKTCRPCCRMS
jgi:uncharacterized membrane protein